jgi:5,6-dimethylbenzimidazole synthase
MPETPPRFDAAFRTTLELLFRWRRDVRRFRADPLETGLLERLLAAAHTAPSVGLSEPWRFVLVESPHRRAAVRESFARANAAALAGYEGERAALYARLKLEGLDVAPVQLALFIDPDPPKGAGLGRQTMPETLAYSAVLAAGQLWLAARAAGVGMGWVSILEPDVVHACLDLPPSWQLIGYFCLGYPETETPLPELEAAGWERRGPLADVLFRR